jgi:nitroreductase
MTTLAGEDLLKQLRWRGAVKKFDSARKIGDADWSALEEALVLTPSSYGLQPWRFLVVRDPEMKKKLRPASWNQAQVEDCSHYVVFAAMKSMEEEYIDRYIDYIVETRKTPPEKLEAYKQMMKNYVLQGEPRREVLEWATRQVYIALGNFMTSAAVMGIDTCPMEGIEPDKYDELLGLDKTGYHTMVACAAGYRHAEDVYSKSAKVRFPKNKIIF